MLGNLPGNHDSFNEAFAAILVAIRRNEGEEVIRSLLQNANLHLKAEEPLNMHEMSVELRADYDGIKMFLSRAKYGDLVLSAINDWLKEGKISEFREPIASISSSVPSINIRENETDELISTVPEKKYIRQDNQYLHDILATEFEGQALKNQKSTYAWKYKSGQNRILHREQDNNGLNIFFLGTSTPPLFGIHSIDVCETGHVISQASLQKAFKSEPSLLVKGIATKDMGPDFPLQALEDPNIQGIASEAWESVRKTITTVKGVGAESRLQLVMNEYFVPNLLHMVSNQPLEIRGELNINLAGHSRGGITTFIMADCANQFIQRLVTGKEGEDYDIDALALKTGMGLSALRTVIANIKSHADNIHIKICALDPVEGARSMAQWDPLGYWRNGTYIPQVIVPVSGLTTPITCSYVEMPPAVKEATVLFAADERRSGFKPTVPTFSENTRVSFIRFHGKHGTLTGNFGNDAGSGQFQYPAFDNDLPFQDAAIGIFDQALMEINKALNPTDSLPSFPLNTFRRIFRQPEYVHTRQLLLSGLKATFGEEISVEKISEEDLIALMDKMMTNNPRANIIIYDCLARDAQTAMENHKEKLKVLEREWRHDTNVAQAVDRDPWQDDRIVFTRGKKVRGKVMWHEHSLEELAPTYLPDALCYGNHMQTVPYHFTSDIMDELALSFYQIKNNISSIAHTRELSKKQIQAGIFNQEFLHFSKLMSIALKEPGNEGLILQMLNELAIDVDYKYHLIPVNRMVAELKHHTDYPLLDKLPSQSIELFVAAIDVYVTTFGVNNLTTDEAKALKNNIDYLLTNNDFTDVVDLIELYHKLEVMIELDQYVVFTEVYIENKRKATGQNTDDISKLGDDLRSFRGSLDRSTAEHARNELERMLAGYIDGKKFQGVISSWVRSEPNSVYGLKEEKRRIEDSHVLSVIKQLEKTDEEGWIVEDLRQYVDGLQQYVDSFRLRSPNASTIELLNKLKEVQQDFANLGAKKSKTIMNKLVQEYIENRAPKFSLLVVSYDPGTVATLKAIKQNRDHDKRQQAELKIKQYSSSQKPPSLN